MKIVLGGVVALLLVVAGGAGAYVLARDNDNRDERAESAALPGSWRLCVNAARGFAIGHPSRWFTDAVSEYTFGGAVEGGPTAYWRRLEATTDEAPLEALVAILSLPYTKVRGLYVWPFAFDRDPRRLADDEVDLLSTFATPKEVRAWREFGGYFGWRAGIEPDGDWVLYVAGD